MDATEADREKAMFVLFPELANQVDGYIGGLTFSDEAEANMLAVAAALAEEREKARVPFLAVMRKIPPDSPELRWVADQIQRAAEEG